MKIAKQGPTNLYDSEIYRSLERQAYKEGFFTPSDKDIVKQASNNVKIASKVNDRMSAANLQPSENVDIDISMLVDGLRNRGYILQAQDVETNYIMFKKAETEYYNLSMETPNDLMEFAHPDGDINVTDIKGELADIETIQSAADKILAVVRKQPSGKLAASAGLIKKNAQEEIEHPGLKNDNTNQDDTEKLNNAYDTLKELVQSFSFNLTPNTLKINFGQFSKDLRYLQIYCNMLNLDMDNVKTSLDKITALQKIGLTTFTADDFKKYIDFNKVGNEQIKKIAQILGLDPNIFTGVSWYYVEEPNKPIKQFACDNDSLEQQYTVNNKAKPNPNSPYIQVFRIDSIYAYSNNIKGHHIINNESITNNIIEKLVAASSTLLSFISTDLLNKVNTKILADTENIVKNVKEAANLCVVPNGAISDTGFIIGKIAVSNMYKTVDAVTKVLNEKYNKQFINEVLFVFEPKIPDNINTFLQQLKSEVFNSVPRLLNTKMIPITEVVQSLTLAKSAWASLPENDKATRIIEEYISGLRSIQPKGDFKPERLVRDFLKSKGYKNGTLSELQVEVDKLITIANKKQK